MRRAGHASQSAALRYQHATDARDRVLADALAQLAGQGEKAS
jgi:hypothetical protein